MTEPESAAPRRRLPDVSLPPLAGGAEAVPLRARRQGTVLVLLGDAVAARDAAYLGELAAAEPALRGWDGRVLVVIAGDGGGARATLEALDALRLPFPVLADAKRVVAPAAGVAVPALVVADQYGEVYEAAAPAGAGAAWLPVRDVEGWLRYLSIRCAG